MHPQSMMGMIMIATLTELRLLRNDEEREIDALSPLMHFRKRNGRPIPESALRQRGPNVPRFRP